MRNHDKKTKKIRAKSDSSIQYLADLNTLVTGQAHDGSLCAEEHMQQICAFYQSIIENMPNHVYWLDKNCVLRGGNNKLADFFGLKSASELAGLTYEEMSRLANWSEGQGQSFKNAELEVMSTGIPRLNVEEPLVFVNGKPVYFISSKVPLSNNKGEIIGVLGITTDITELKETQAALEQAKERAEAGEKAKTEFIANVSHDMRTPLSGIIHLAHDLKEEGTRDEERKELFSQLAESGDALLEMFEEILEDVAAEHMTEHDVTLETFDISRLVDKLVKLEKPSLTQKGLQFLTHIDPNIPQYLVSDRRKIHRILLNLLSNAVKFTDKGRIELTLELLEKTSQNICLKFNVMDTGFGVPEASKAHLFERFYKASPSHKGEHIGFGLGLHIAKNYTHLLGGSIGFESTQGLGSNFYIILTLQIPSEEAIMRYHEKLAYQPSLLQTNSAFQSAGGIAKKPSPFQPTAIQALPDAPCVLLVEDNIIVLRTLSRKIKSANLNVLEVENGETALELAKTRDFDLILTDVGLPGISGIEFTQQLRAFEKENHKNPVPIVGITAHAVDGRNECLDVGMSGVVPKPLTDELFAEILQNFLPFFHAPKNAMNK